MSFFFMAEYHSTVYTYHIFFFHSSVNEHSNRFHIMAIVNKPVNEYWDQCITYFHMSVFISLGYKPRCAITRSYGKTLSSFVRKHQIISSKVALSFCILTNNEWGRGQWQPTPVLLPGGYQGLRSLVGCSPWGREESDTTERLHFHFSLSCIGEGNGNPLQCSCLENPKDGGAW